MPIELTADQMLRFDMIRPCADCPFRTDTPCALGEHLAEEVILGMMAEGHAFGCHKTIQYENPETYAGGAFAPETQHCAGALIFAEKMKVPGKMTEMAIRKGVFDPSRLDMNAPVVSDVTEFQQGQLLAYERELFESFSAEEQKDIR